MKQDVDSESAKWRRVEAASMRWRSASREPPRREGKLTTARWSVSP
ncbi:MAG: hypothetical protein J6X76_00965 [Bacteroidaceae bacterium]|nr:hypothetical protein [Bacteroidaceae bacterium]